MLVACLGPRLRLVVARDEVEADLRQQVCLVERLHEGALQTTSEGRAEQKLMRAKRPRRDSFTACRTEQWFGQLHSKGERVEKIGGKPFCLARSMSPGRVSL